MKQIKTKEKDLKLILRFSNKAWREFQKERKANKFATNTDLIIDSLRLYFFIKKEQRKGTRIIFRNLNKSWTKVEERELTR